jgi:cytosine/adenosine deaminase-related metal-dependent hydrolase
MDEGTAFIYHLSEGTDLKLIGEYELARSQRMLHPRFCGIHCTALRAPQFEEWEREAGTAENGTIVWSPFSNLWLYRATTDVATAHDKGMNICLGSDWSPSGSKNLLGELKVADLWNNTNMDRAFTARELCAMATRNPAHGLGWGDRIGRLRADLHADILVTADRGGDPYDNLITSIEHDVQLVAINGQPFYGTRGLMSRAGATQAEPIAVGRHTAPHPARVPRCSRRRHVLDGGARRHPARDRRPRGPLPGDREVPHRRSQAAAVAEDRQAMG